ncbi:MAG: hypothetical protein QOG59_622, partial [Solirubrobacteraceae bacterium]|nr:hypothetical protein [Solirubrobacteraceae bacterium]
MLLVAIVTVDLIVGHRPILLPLLV